MVLPRHVLVIGLDPRRVPGPWDPEPVVAAIERGMARFDERGIDAESCLFGLDGEDIEATVTTALRSRSWDCVVIGGGVREPEELLELFERVVNLVRRHAPDATIAFNARADDTADAAVRACSYGPPDWPRSAPADCYDCYMTERLAHRDLRNNSSAVLRAVAQGSSFEITNHGEVVALLSPAEVATDLRVTPPRTPGSFSSLTRVRAQVSTEAVLAELREER